MIVRRLLALVLAPIAALAITACNPDQARPDLAATYNARQCIIDHESRNDPAGMYLAKNDFGSSALGAYQWLDGVHHIWNHNLELAEQYYVLRLTSPEEDQAGARFHASAASPYTQDLVTAFVLLNRPENQHPWTYSECWRKVGQPMELRDDGPVNQPTPFIQAQIDAYHISLQPPQPPYRPSHEALPLPAGDNAVRF